ncbi:MAG: hypothetical protein II095_06690 [Bacteroidales bacterium]|nr:hypothetical protein [Bacteroidales bacterium]
MGRTVDAVVTYVDGSDPQWLKEYAAAVGESLEPKRFRDWGLLRYLLRGISTYMPFVENVYLVVSGEGQVPSWLSSEVKVVYHRDIIPEEFLPVFNSCAIEMFLHRIPGLAERFVYFNDDVIPLMPCSEEDFFRGDCLALDFRKGIFATNMYTRQVLNSSNMARKALGMRPSQAWVRPPHSCMPMLRSASAQAFDAVDGDILSRISALREPRNLNQYFFVDYLYYAGRTVKGSLTRKHLSLGVKSGRSVRSFILAPDRHMACINDVSMTEDRFLQLRDEILAALQERLPERSRFEL